MTTLLNDLKSYDKYNMIVPTSNRPAQLYGTAKTHKIENVDEIALDNLKFWPIIAQTDTYTYNAAQVIVEYLSPLYNENICIIKNALCFVDTNKKQRPLAANNEFMSYDVEPLFNNIPISKTIDYIMQQIYVENKLPKICSKLVFKRLLLKLTIESTVMFTGSFYKQVDGCAMGGLLSVVFSSIFMIKLETSRVINETKLLQTFCRWFYKLLQSF